MARRHRIKPIDLAATVEKLLAEYGEKVYDVMNDSVAEVADQATDKLRAVNHWANQGSGEYSGSWMVDDVVKKRIHVTKVVHNEEHYRLTHLLENGHVSRNGTGRTFTTAKAPVQAYPHIAPVNDWANEELPKIVERKINNI